MDISEVIAKELNIEKWQTEAVIDLIDAGDTIPFIARYRKERHGALNDEKLRALDARLKYLRGLEEKKKTVLSGISAQGKLTDALQKAVDSAMTQAELEDLYRPYRQKRNTRAMAARERGLEPLALYILGRHVPHSVEEEAKKYVDTGKGVPDTAAAIRMAEDIIAEKVQNSAKYRTYIFDLTMREGVLAAVKAKKSEKREKGEKTVNKKLAKREDVYETYYDYSSRLTGIPGYRILAINRGEKEKFLEVRIEAPEEKIVDYLVREQCLIEVPEEGRRKDDHSFRKPLKQQAKIAPAAIENPLTIRYIREACKDAYKRLIQPSVETKIRGELTKKAEDSAIKVFASNLRQYLMQPPVQGKVVLGWDPAFRTGCKLAVVDETGKILDTAVIYPTAPQNKVEESKKVLKELCIKYGVDIISCGNGTASRESEKIIAAFIKESGLPLRYVIVNEAGASVYSASETAAEEFPDFDTGQRSAASIARRLQDPLAELVKIDPKAIGVGQYQHDINETKLTDALEAVVEDCVNGVGVDVNTASAVLLSYVSGISKTVAKNIVSYREENGKFRERKELRKVPKLGPRTYEQCAGFLRIRGGLEPLDMTGVHPESYDAAGKILKKLGYTREDILSGKTADIKKRAGTGKMLSLLAGQTGLGTFTLEDVLKELEKPGRDPREKVQGPILSSDVLKISDLKEGMVLTGTVRNVVDFGAFVDIGVHEDGLVHISELSDRYVKHPLDVVSVGQIVRVRVQYVDEKRNRISLSMKGVDQKA